jgi:hypothetical protein
LSNADLLLLDPGFTHRGHSADVRVRPSSASSISRKKAWQQQQQQQHAMMQPGQDVPISAADPSEVRSVHRPAGRSPCCCPPRPAVNSRNKHLCSRRVGAATDHEIARSGLGHLPFLSPPGCRGNLR